MGHLQVSDVQDVCAISTINRFQPLQVIKYRGKYDHISTLRCCLGNDKNQLALNASLVYLLCNLVYLW